MAHRAGPRQRPTGGRRAGPERNRRRSGRAAAPGRARRRDRRLDGLYDPAIAAERARAGRGHTPGRHVDHPDVVRSARPQSAQCHQADRPRAGSGAGGATPGARRSGKGRAAGQLAPARAESEAQRRGRAGDDSPPRRRRAHRGGGGGPPVYDDPTLRLEGLDAVADKDRVAAILGREIAADALLILTNVDAVYHAYGTPQQKAIRRLTLAQADHLLAGKELGTGSMRPKVEAAADFVRAGEGGRGHRAIIAELAQGLAALQGEAGTTITKD